MRADMSRALFLLLVLTAAGAIAVPSPAGEGIVVSVRMEGQDPSWGLEALLTVVPGGEKDPVEVRRSVQNLYDSGRLEQVEVLEEPTEGGIGLVFKVFPYPEVKRTERRCRGCSRPPIVLPGTPCTPELLQKIEGALLTDLARNGYLHPALNVACRGGTLAVEGDRGARSVIAGIDIAADGGGPALEALRKLQGKPYRKEKVAAKVAAAEKKLRKKRPQARLRVTGVEETPEGIVLRLDASGMAPVEFVASGDATDKDAERVKRSFRGEPLSEEMLEQKADELADRYQAQGYVNAKAALTAEPALKGKRVAVGLTLGRKFTVSGLVLTGLPAGLETSLDALLPPVEGEPFDAERAREWQGVLADHLLRDGYLDAVVRGPDPRLDEAAGTAELHYRVEPGRQYLPGTVEVRGLPDGLETPTLGVRAGHPLDPDLVQADLEAIQAAVDGEGYGNARVTVQKEEDRLTYVVEPGPRVVADRIFFRGLWFTRPERIWPEVTLRAGRPAGFGGVLETQSRLYGTGLFSSVEVKTRPEPEDPSRSTVVLQVEEDTPRSYTYGLGYDTYDGVRVQGGLYHNNLFGTRRAVGLDGRYSGKEQQWRLFYREPTFFFIPNPIQISVYQSLEQRPDFSLDKWGSSAEMMRMLGKRTKIAFRYSYELQDAFDITEGYPIPREDADKKVSSIGAGYFHDARDDPFYPTAGRFLSLDLRYAFPLRAATSHFVKGDLRGAIYFTPVKGGTVALSARVGGITNKLDDEEVPLGERFFLGGRDTVRAFSRDAVGVDGQTVVDGSPVGGNSFLLFNLEWRQRIASWLGLSLFLDSGQVWAERDRMDVSDLKIGTGYGVGLLFFSPLGPIRVEYSKKLEPCAWDPDDQWYFGIGVPF